jgi:hypothetical protein
MILNTNVVTLHIGNILWLNMRFIVVFISSSFFTVYSLHHADLDCEGSALARGSAKGQGQEDKHGLSLFQNVKGTLT